MHLISSCLFASLLFSPLTSLAQQTWNPTPKLYDDLASGRVGLLSLIDPAYGVAVVDTYVGPVDGAKPKKPALLCGAALDLAIGNWQKALREDIMRTKAEGQLTCGPAFGAYACRYGATMEWDPAVYHVFAKEGGRHRLAAVVVIDEAAVEEDFARTEHRKVQTTLNSLLKKKCTVPKLSAQQLNDLGFAARQRGDHTAAIKHYSEALIADPRFELAAYNLACEHALKGSHEFALELLGHLRSLRTPASKKALAKALSDPDFRSMKDSAAFRAIVSP